MSIAEKVLQLKQDFDNVFAAGKAAGGGGTDYSSFATSIRFYSLNDFGKSEVELNLDRATELSSLFNESDNAVRVNKTVEHLTINGGEITNMYTAFNTANYSDTTLKRLTLNCDTSKCVAFFQTFRGRRALKIIDGKPLNFSSVPNANSMNNPFMQNVNLVEFRVVANTIKYNFNVSSCGNLSAETIQSIVDGLADLSSGTAQTLTVHADVGAKLTDMQKATITTKNWTLVY